MIWQVVRVGVFIPSFMVPLALLALGGDGRPQGLAAIVAAQGLAFLPVAVMLVVRALGTVPADLEQAAELLGAPRATIVWRITLGVAGLDLVRAALAVLGLCLADVATPLCWGAAIGCWRARSPGRVAQRPRRWCWPSCARPSRWPA